jgi:hypothetical protein
MIPSRSVATDGAEDQNETLSGSSEPENGNADGVAEREREIERLHAKPGNSSWNAIF